MNFHKFISTNKSLIIAPAGYGKTYSLAECLAQINNDRTQLILTHTHAGIASIKEKIKEFGISSHKYHIATITGFAQKYVLSFYSGDDIPDQEDSSNYFPFMVSKAKELFKLEPIKRTIKCSYENLFVDEYQDCTKTQHEMLMVLSNTIPIHILGDPLQGIFEFRDSLVDFENDLNDFDITDELETPWRWQSDENNEYLGDALEHIRKTLLSDNKSISLFDYHPVIDVKQITEQDIYKKQSAYRKIINDILINKDNDRELDSLLILVPQYYNNDIPIGGIKSRAKLKTQIDYRNQLQLLEAIDDQDFYRIAKKIDDLIVNINSKRKKIKALVEVFCRLFNKGCILEWFKDNRLINKRKPKLLLKNKLESIINIFLCEPSVTNFLDIIYFMIRKMKFKYKRKDLLYSILKAMNIANIEKKSVYESMKCHKNIVRQVGRKIYGKCLGTTLLTKGLEFDTVVILNAHRYNNYKHFYVAITRACKNLIIFSETDTLEFNN